MIADSEIKQIIAREILDSRSNPTVEATVILASGAQGTASVPSGASTGIHEAYEKRDGGMRYGGKGTLLAVEAVNNRIAPALIGMSALDRERADTVMIALDGTQNKSNLGANAILSVSLALCRAAADHLRLPLYRYIGSAFSNVLPVPMMNIMNGGAHANNNIDVQEFMVVPIGAENEREAVRMGAEVYSALKKKLSSLGLSVAVGDEGGFAPTLSGEREAIELILDSVKSAGYKAGEDIALALDMASSEWYRPKSGDYYLPKSKRTLGREDLATLITSLCHDYPIISVEDGMAEDDVDGWRILSEREGKKRLLVGDDLFVTNKDRLDAGIKSGIANAILIKPNQIGTLTEVAEAVALAKANGYKTVMSHRSGETADSFISDLAVGLGCELIKAGAPARSERTEKYNRLMRIENELFNPIFAKDFL